MNPAALETQSTTSHRGQATTGTKDKARACRAIIRRVTIYWGAVIGFFLGFGFGVGCALAVMYSIYLGGYRAAVRDSDLPEPPERLQRTRARVAAEARKTN